MNKDIPLGFRHTYGGSTTPYSLPIADLTRHVHVLGKTGMGKSTLLKSIFLELLRAGEGVGIIDPHGDLVSELLDAIPAAKIASVILLDPADRDFAPSMNVIGNYPVAVRPQIASILVAAFRHLWKDSWGPRLEYIRYNAIRALLDCQNATLLGLPLLLSDRTYRAWVIGQIQDPFIRRYWTEEFESYEPRFRLEAIAPIQNKIGQLLAIPVIRETIGQVKRKVNFRECMDEKKILLIHLPKGRLGEDPSKLLGALMVALLGSTALERADVPQEKRPPFTLIVDEAQNFVTDSFASILSEARKYGLGVVLCHQYMEQLSDSVRAAVLGNAGTTICFRAGADDGQILSRQYSEAFAPHQFTSLPAFETLIRPLSTERQPFRLSLSPITLPFYRRSEKIRRAGRLRFGAPRDRVREKMLRWMEARGR